MSTRAPLRLSLSSLQRITRGSTISSSPSAAPSRAPGATPTTSVPTTPGVLRARLVVWLAGCGHGASIAEETAVLCVVDAFLQQHSLCETPQRDRIMPLMHLLMDDATRACHVQDALHAFSRRFQSALAARTPTLCVMLQ